MGGFGFNNVQYSILASVPDSLPDFIIVVLLQLNSFERDGGNSWYGMVLRVLPGPLGTSMAPLCFNGYYKFFDCLELCSDYSFSFF